MKISPFRNRKLFETITGDYVIEAKDLDKTLVLENTSDATLTVSTGLYAGFNCKILRNNAPISIVHGSDTLSGPGLYEIYEATILENGEFRLQKPRFKFDENIKIVNKSKLAAALNRSKSERVAVIGMSDSNMQFDARGYSWYFAKALYENFGCYGTGLYQIGSGTHNLYLASSYDGEADDAAPAALDVFGSSSETLPAYVCIPDGSSKSVGSSGGVFAKTSAYHPIEASGNIRFRYTFGRFALGTDHSHTPLVRRAESPWSTLASGASRNVVTGTDELEDYIIDMAAGTAEDSYPLNMLSRTNNTTMPGPFYWLYAQAANSDKTSGVSHNTFVSHSGGSLRDMLSNLNSFGSTGLGEYMRQVRLELTSTNKTAVVWINSGLNDRNESSASLGPSPVSDGDSPAAYEDNLRGIVTAVQDAWVAQGGTASTIHFCFMPSHPQSKPDDSELDAYRQVAAKLATELDNASCVLLQNIAGYDEFDAGGWYDGAGNAHLENIGYEELCKKIVREIRGTSNLTKTKELDFGSIAAGGQETQTIFLSGAIPGETVSLGLSAVDPGLIYNAYVDTNHLVNIRVVNSTASAIHPATNDFTVTLVRD